MRTSAPTITMLPPSPDDERRGRMIKYTIAMAIRVVCIILCIVVPGWWVVIPVLGAVFLPYFAVLIANSTTTKSGSIESPGGVMVRVTPPSNEPA